MEINGYQCLNTGEIAGRDIPLDGQYYLTSFGGGSDTQSVACGGPIADGTWYYMADSWRWPCGTKILITNPQNGLGVVAQVADVGPNICVEQAAGKPVIDASPLVSQALFGTTSRGWSDRSLVLAEVVDPSTPLGPAQGDLNAGLAGRVETAVIAGGLATLAAWAGWMAWKRGELAAFGLPAPKRSRRRR